jgi:hypothetical protein
MNPICLFFYLSLRNQVKWAVILNCEFFDNFLHNLQYELKNIIQLLRSQRLKVLFPLSAESREPEGKAFGPFFQKFAYTKPTLDRWQNFFLILLGAGVPIMR